MTTHEQQTLPYDVERTRSGRPRAPSEPVVRKLCEEIMLGKSLDRICREDPRMPTKRTILKWLADPANSAFRERYYNARRVQAELRVDEIFDIADDSSRDYKPVYDENGNIIRYDPDNEHIQRSRVRVDTRKWYASKMLPRIYGDRVLNELDVTGDLAELLKKASNKTQGLPPPRGKVIEHEDG